jgi:hypothetical protein
MVFGKKQRSKEKIAKRDSLWYDEVENYGL